MSHNIQKLNNIGFFDIKPGLERIKKVLSFLDNPQHKINSVLIAGTNGKGSVASMLSSILILNGYKTGLYTSPHLVSVTERLKINSINISEITFDEILKKVFDACKETQTELSYFELVTTSSFIYFEEENIDLAVLEVGMGGRWDATNVVNPLVSVITNISFDHSEHLGNTLELIAGEKAEIIKENRPVVSGVRGKELSVIREKALATNSDLYIFGDDFNIKINENNTFNYQGIISELENLSCNLGGKHQVANSSLALASAELLSKEYGYMIDPDKTAKALHSVNYEGRAEIVRKKPLMVLDTAHNTSAAISLVNTLKGLEESRFVFMISMLSDKNHEEFFSALSGIAEKIIITKIPNERAAGTKNLYDISRNYIEDVVVIEDHKEAYEYVKSLKTPVCITGSVYLIGLIKEIM